MKKGDVLFKRDGISENVRKFLEECHALFEEHPEQKTVFARLDFRSHGSDE